MSRGPNAAFNEWAGAWIELARFDGARLPDEAERIEGVAKLWGASIPPDWERDADQRLLDRATRYGRGVKRADHVPRGEYIIEQEILGPSPAEVTTTCLGARLVDGVNAVPLTKDAGGHRTANVEADMLLLVGGEDRYALQLVEVKAESNDAWYAAVENLRQLRLLQESAAAVGVFHTRCAELNLPEELPVAGIVLARRSFYEARGKRAESVGPAQRLLDRMRAETGIDAWLATWDLDTRAIECL